MSFNVLTTELPTEGEVHFSDVWANRSDFNVKVIKRYQPDVIGFQELEPGHLETYRQHLTEYDDCLADVHTPGMTNAILWNRECFRRLDAGMFWLSGTPDVYSVDWGVDEPVTMTWVLLADTRTHQRFLCANTQFMDGAEGEKSRLESSKLAAQHLPVLAGEAPVIAMGDFNCNPWTPAYRTFMSNGFIDTYRAAGHGDSAESSTFHGFHGTKYFALEWGDELFWRVDWILSRDAAQHVQTTSCTVVRDAEPPMFASDHYPVVTEFMLL
jgi:endonuclease/exonuclease/phosphatase family metal-dependent hydrolase